MTAKGKAPKPRAKRVAVEPSVPVNAANRKEVTELKSEDTVARALKTFGLKESDVYSITDKGDSIRILTKNAKKFIYPKTGG